MAGDWSTIGSPSRFVKRLTARTSNSCSSPLSGSPAASGPAVKGELHGVHSEPSTEHWKVTPSAAVWSDENVNTPLALVVSAGGCESIRVCGSPSTVQLRTAGVGSTFGGSARSNDRTRSVCEPVARPVSSYRPGVGSTLPSGARARTYITCGPPLTPVLVYGCSEQST